MSDTPETAAAVPPDEIPSAVVERRRYRSSQLIWIIPALALLIGLSLLVKAYLEKGTEITISFKSGDGVEAGKTKVKYKDVEIGLVRSVTIAPDRASVLVTAEITRSAAGFLKADTRFWVVRPRITGGTISGLETLTAGSYIGMDVGKSNEPKTVFTGLDAPPVVTMDVPGRLFTLHAANVGSLRTGSPLLYRHVQVGEVLSTELDKDGEDIIVRVFVRAPYDKFVRRNTLFWHTSGIDFKLDANGVKINTGSLMSLLMGGIAFLTPDDVDEEPPAATNHKFILFSDQEEALKRPDTLVENYRLVFRESVRGLSVGAPVDLRGMEIGEVTRITAELDQTSKKVAMAVNIRFYPGRLKTRSPSNGNGDPQKLARAQMDAMVKQGLRAQLRSGNLLTGQMYVALDFFSETPSARVNWSAAGMPELPTVAGMMAQFQTSLARIITKLEKVPLAELAEDSRKTVKTLDQTLKSADRLLNELDGKLVPEARQVLDQTRTTMQQTGQTLEAVKQTLAADGSLQLDLRDTLRELSKAAHSLRQLGDYLERHPEALIRGKKEDPR